MLELWSRASANISDRLPTIKGETDVELQCRSWQPSDIRACISRRVTWRNTVLRLCIQLYLFTSSGVTRVGDTQGGNWGCQPSFFPEKPDDFFAHRCQLSLSLSLFIAFTRVSPPRGCHTALFLPVRPRFATILCKFAHKIFSFGCHPPGGCHPGRSAPLWRHCLRASTCYRWRTA